MNGNFNEILKKCFGKEKDDKYHALAMLIIYTLFIFIIILVIRLGGGSSNLENNNNSNVVIPTTTPIIDNNDDNSNSGDKNSDLDNINLEENDINYSYSYTITYNGVVYVFLGKKIDEKEKFTYIDNGVVTEYAKLSDNYYILENDIYSISDNPNRFLKYCDMQKLFLLLQDKIFNQDGNTIQYNLKNTDISSIYDDTISIDNEQLNSIILNIQNDVLRSVDLNYNNYISSVEGTNLTLNLHLEFSDIGTTSDFEININ